MSVKTSPLVIVLLAVGSSVATVAVLRLLDDPPPATAESPEAPTVAAPTSSNRDPVETVAQPVELVAPRPPDDRLAEIERRLSALELAIARREASVTSEDTSPQENDLRDQVLAWVEEDRAAKSRARALEAEDQARKQSEFDARYRALMLAQEHGLADWHRDKFTDVFLLTDERRREIEAQIDPLTDDPETVEALWVEYDEWVDELEREVTALDPELYEKIYGED